MFADGRTHRQSPLLNPASAYAARGKNKAVLHYPMQIGVCGGGGGDSDVGCRGTVASLICGFQDVSILLHIYKR